MLGVFIIVAIAFEALRKKALRRNLRKHTKGTNERRKDKVAMAGE
jgi:hypothetical protein